MKLTFCQEYALGMPERFPITELERFLGEARRVLLDGASTHDYWKEFGTASNLIGWRFRASAEAWDAYQVSIANFPAGGNHEEIYQRERALFVMLAAGVSSFESLAYAVAAAASHPRVLGMPFGAQQQRECSPKRLSEWLATFPKAAALCSTLAAAVGSDEWTLWLRLRNRMSHRSNLPRHIRASVGGAEPPRVKPIHYAATSTTPELELDVGEFDALHGWLSVSLQTVLATAGALLHEA